MLRRLKKEKLMDINEEDIYLIDTSDLSENSDKHWFQYMILLNKSNVLSNVIKIEFDQRYPFIFPKIYVADKNIKSILFELSKFFNHKPYCLCCNHQKFIDSWGPTLNVKYILRHLKETYEIIDDLILFRTVFKVIDLKIGHYVPIEQYLFDTSVVQLFFTKEFLK